MILRAIRLKEIQRLIWDRHRGADKSMTLRESLRLARVAIHTIQDPDAALLWIDEWCPIIPKHWRDRYVAFWTERFNHYKADSIATLLNVTIEDRQRLGLRTIGACDIPLAERFVLAASKKREDDRGRKEAERRRAGVTPRRKGQRWVEDAAAMGVSRTTFYRRRAAQKKASQVNDK